MRRTLMRLVLMAVMVAMAAAMAVPAFAAPPDSAGGFGGCFEDPATGETRCGGGGGMSNTSGNLFDPECDPTIQPCSGTVTGSGGSGGGTPGAGAGGGGGGRFTESSTLDLTDPENPVFDTGGSFQGGNAGTGGGNCTFESDPSSPTGFTVDGHGPRCEQPYPAG